MTLKTNKIAMSKSGQKRKPRTLGLFIGTKVLWKIYLLG
jgi:hypothetical protein